MLLSLVVYSHHLTPYQWSGVGLVFVGLAIEAREKRREGLMKKVASEGEGKAKVKDA